MAYKSSFDSEEHTGNLMQNFLYKRPEDKAMPTWVPLNAQKSGSMNNYSPQTMQPKPMGNGIDPYRIPGGLTSIGMQIDPNRLPMNMSSGNMTSSDNTMLGKIQAGPGNQAIIEAVLRKMIYGG